MKNFEGFGLSGDLNKSLSKMDYTTPTPIQAKAIPLALQGRDILGSAQTGTGKTAAFSIPLVEMLLRSPRGGALVLTPTRELAKQVLDVIHQLLGPQSPLKTAFIIGGEPMGKQFSQLRARPRIIVGTPGRINDHLQRGSLKLDETSFLVLDETDRMLDMGFGVQLDRILKFLPEQRQTLMFSATLPKAIIQISEKYLSNPERVSMGATNVVALNIKQDIIRIDQEKKYGELVSQLHERSGSVIVFAKTKHSADRMAKNLRRDGFTSEALHGDLRQTKREKVMKNFRNQNFRILVATDIAARGLDVPHIEHVINYDLPQVAEDYIHRMGRTARAGAEGSALCFISPQDGKKWRAIEQLLNPGAKASSEGPRNDRKSHKGRRRNDRPAHKNGPRHERSEDNGKGAHRHERSAGNKKPFRHERSDENGKSAPRHERSAGNKKPFRHERSDENGKNAPRHERSDAPHRNDNHPKPGKRRFKNRNNSDGGHGGKNQGGQSHGGKRHGGGNASHGRRPHKMAA